MLKFRVYDKERAEHLDDPHYPRTGGWGRTQAVTTDGTLIEFWFTGGMSEAVPHVSVLPPDRYEIRMNPQTPST